MAWRDLLEPKAAVFKVRWNISNDEFDNISNKSIVREFSTPYKHTVCDWKAEFKAGTLANSVTFGISHGGPMNKVRFNFSLFMIHKNERLYKDFISGQLTCDLEIQKQFIVRDIDRIEAITDVSSGQFRMILTVVLPYFAFSYVDFFGIPKKCESDWVIALHSKIENPESQRSDVQLVSGDGQTFYCHQVVFDSQMVFDAMFRHATTDEEKRGIFRFPSMTADNLRKALEYLYLGTTNLVTITVPDLLQLVDFAEQYGLKALKGIAAQRLWDIAVEKPDQCIDIARLANLHADTGLLYLRNRCFDVLAENYDKLGLNVDDLDQDAVEPHKKKKRASEEENQRSTLRQEFFVYLCRRLVGLVKS